MSRAGSLRFIAAMVWSHLSWPPESGGWVFNDQGIHRLRCIEQLRTACGMNLTAIRMIVSLMEEVERLEQEIRFLRSR